jgi:hypothetical protein
LELFLLDWPFEFEKLDFKKVFKVI